jgi:probable HAF family extracellular repeat protein
MHDLGTLAGEMNSQSRAYDINDTGNIVGQSDPAVEGSQHAFLYDGAMHDIGTLGGPFSVAFALNNVNHITGTSLTRSPFDGGSYHAFFYDGTMHDLGSLGGLDSTGLDINSSDQIVGNYDTGDGNTHPFIYSRDMGMVDLNSLIDPSADWDLVTASGINDAGQIVGSDIYERAYLLTPVPEPSSATLFGIGLTLVTQCFARKHLRQRPSDVSARVPLLVCPAVGMTRNMHQRMQATVPQ